MAEDQEKKEAGQSGGPPTPEVEDGGPAAEVEQQTVLPGLDGTTPTGDVVVPFDKITELMKEKGAAKVKAVDAAEQSKVLDRFIEPEEVKDPDDRDEYEMSYAELEERRKAEKQQQRRRGRPPKEKAPHRPACKGRRECVKKYRPPRPCLASGHCGPKC